jgi:hypothetical protein
MAIVAKILGQENPAATTLTTLYTVPASTSAVASTLTVCNMGGSQTSFRVAVRGGGAAIANKHYLYYDLTIPGNDAFASTIGLALSSGDVVSVYAANTNLAFSLFGQEIQS